MVQVGGVGERTKNFINSNKQATYYNTTFKIEGSKVTLTGTPTGAGGRNSLCTDSILLSAGTYIFSNTNPNIGVQIVDESSNNSLSNPFTLTEEKNVHIGVYIKQSQVGSEFNEVDYWQLEEGSIATDYELYGYKVPVVVSGKNLLPPIKEWESGYLNISGTVSSANVERKEMTSPFIKVNPNETYAFSFYPNEGDAWRCAGYYTANKEFVSRKFASATSDPIIFTIPANVEFIRLSYRTYGDGTYAQLEQNSEVTTYEPYIEPTTTNIYLDEPIEENESISLSDTNTDIPTIRGTNVLTVDTTVQPSNVYVKVRKESQYETIMRERYEEAQAQLDALESEGE